MWPKKSITTINFFLHQKPISNLKIGFGFLWTLGILIFDVKSFAINFLAFCKVASNYLNVDINIVYAKIRNIIIYTFKLRKRVKTLDYRTSVNDIFFPLQLAPHWSNARGCVFLSPCLICNVTPMCTCLPVLKRDVT